MTDDLELMIYDSLIQQYGGFRELIEQNTIIEKLTSLSSELDKMVSKYKDNPNDVNYNMMIVLLITYQYWKQKKSFEFTTEVDF